MNRAAVTRFGRTTWGVVPAPSPTHVVRAATGAVVSAGTDLGDADEPVGVGDRDTLDDPAVERTGIGGLTLDTSVLVADAVVDRLDGVDTRFKRIQLVGLDRGEVRVFGGLPCRRSSVRSDTLAATGDRPDQFNADFQLRSRTVTTGCTHDTHTRPLT